VLTGTVTGQNAAGQTMVSTSAGTLALSTGSSPPAGTQLALELVGRPQPPVPGAAGQNASPQPGRFAGIEEALQLLGRLSEGSAASQAGAAAGGQQALQMLQAMIPQQSAQLAPTMLFFMQALRGGGLDGLVREKTLDLMVRTQRALPEPLRDGIRGLFADQVSALGFSGTVSFQVVRQFDIRPIEETGAGSSGVTV
jgi:hypothetical protein